MIDFSCHVCSRKLRAKDESAGKKVKCPGCGQIVAVPKTVSVGSPHPEAKGQPGANTEASGKPAANGPETEVPTAPRTHSAANEQVTISSLQRGEQTVDGAPDRSNVEEADLAGLLAMPERPDEIGRIGGYRVLKILGRGGMGVVYLAEDLQLERKVALKTMLPAVAANATAKERFLREAKLAASIEHEHIVAIFQVGIERGVPFLAMPLLQGCPLDALLREKSMQVGEALRIGREIAEGLSAAHARGLIHRDIKPGNIWLEGDRRKVKILDFGLARTADDAAQLTQSGAIVGTPAYMAPEQARGQKLDFRADLFSLGCILYESLTGKRPFTGSDTMSILSSLALDTPPAPAEVNPAVPGNVSAIVMKLLEKDPADRHHRAADVAEEIRAIESLDPSVSKTVIWNPSAKPRRRAGPIALGAAAYVVLLAALVSISYFAWIRQPPVEKIADNIPNIPLNPLPNPAKQPPIEGDRFVLRFDGKNQYLHAMHRLKDNEGPLTVEGWTGANVDSLEPHKPYLLFSCTQWKLAAVRDNNGRAIWRLYHLDPPRNTIDSPNEIPRNVMQHVAVVFEKGTMSLFVDGKHCGEKPAKLRDVVDPPSPGPSQWAATNEHGFSGTLANVRISSVGRYHEDFIPSLAPERDGDTIVQYPMDEGKGSILRDVSRNGLHTQVVGATWVKQSLDARIPNIPLNPSKQPPIEEDRFVLRFDGKNQFLFGKYRLKEDRGPLTVEGWTGIDVKSIEKGNGYHLFSGSQWSLSVFRDDNDSVFWRLYHFDSPQDVIVSPNEIPPDVMQHVAVVFDKGVMSLFVDGKHCGEKPAKLRDGVDPPTPGPSEHVAKIERGFFGTLANIRVSSVARYREDFVPSLVQERDAATVVQCPMDEGKGDTLCDTSRNGFHLQFIGATWVKQSLFAKKKIAAAVDPAAIDTALEFNGIDSGIEVPSLTFDGSHPITIEARIRVEPTSDRNDIDGWHGVAGWGGIFGLVANNAKMLAVESYHVNPDGKKGSSNAGASLAKHAAGKLVHVAGVYDGKSLRIFANGSLTGRSDCLRIRDASVIGGLWTDHFAIGCSISISKDDKRKKLSFFKGVIDEVRVSNVARYTDAFFPPSGKFTPDDSTMALYHFDESQGTIAKDSSGHGHDGKIFGAKWTKVSTAKLSIDRPPTQMVAKEEANSKIRVGGKN